MTKRSRRLCFSGLNCNAVTEVLGTVPMQPYSNSTHTITQSKHLAFWWSLSSIRSNNELREVAANISATYLKTRGLDPLILSDKRKGISSMR